MATHFRNWVHDDLYRLFVETVDRQSASLVHDTCVSLTCRIARQPWRRREQCLDTRSL